METGFKFCLKKPTGDEIRRFRTPITLSYGEVVALLREWWPGTAAPETSFSLTYTDPEGDVVTLSSEMEWRECVGSLLGVGVSLIRVTVVVSSAAPQQHRPWYPPMPPMYNPTPNIHFDPWQIPEYHTPPRASSVGTTVHEYIRNPSAAHEYCEDWEPEEEVASAPPAVTSALDDLFPDTFAATMLTIFPGMDAARIAAVRATSKGNAAVAIDALFIKGM